MIGRKKEIQELERLYQSQKAEFVALYGRRRVGKTFLISETFNNRFTFKHSGLSPIENKDTNNTVILKNQLKAFYNSLCFYGGKNGKAPKSWFEAFNMLSKLLDSKDENEKMVVFLDELPWMDTPRSNFVTAFEYFWNSYGCYKNNLLLIVCGSANSWILNNLINNHGGLYNRLTYNIHLQPFTLKECKEYFLSRNISFSNYDIAICYMVMGGIPYYLSYLKEGLSLYQNLDMLFFDENAILKDEFDRLFNSIFHNPIFMKKIVTLLAKRNSGYTRNEIIKELDIESSGSLSASLYSLCASGFITSYVPFKGNGREPYYKLIDPYCNFYLKVMKEKKSNFTSFMENIDTHVFNTWKGLGFENLIFNNINQIKWALGISGIKTSESSFVIKSDDTSDRGCQIDLIIDRADNIVSVCEMKFFQTEYLQEKDEHMKLVNRNKIISNLIPKRKSIQNVLITSFGLIYNEYSGDYNRVFTLDDLFI